MAFTEAQNKIYEKNLKRLELKEKKGKEKIKKAKKYGKLFSNN